MHAPARQHEMSESDVTPGVVTVSCVQVLPFNAAAESALIAMHWSMLTQDTPDIPPAIAGVLS